MTKTFRLKTADCLFFSLLSFHEPQFHISTLFSLPSQLLGSPDAQLLYSHGLPSDNSQWSLLGPCCFLIGACEVAFLLPPSQLPSCARERIYRFSTLFCTDAICPPRVSSSCSSQLSVCELYLYSECFKNYWSSYSFAISCSSI